MSNFASINNSGNSDVDVNVQVDTSALAYAMLCYLHTSGMVNDEQFMQMVTNFNHLLGKQDAVMPTLLSNQDVQSAMIRSKNDIHTLKQIF
ncbi:hypothetical protein ACFDTO_25370 [Microbacteriaceae bacterium 4G12]